MSFDLLDPNLNDFIKRSTINEDISKEPIADIELIIIMPKVVNSFFQSNHSPSPTHLKIGEFFIVGNIGNNWISTMNTSSKVAKISEKEI